MTPSPGIEPGTHSVGMEVIDLGKFVFVNRKVHSFK